MKRPDYLFEVSWEVCNKVGGIHTVVSTKAAGLSKLLGANYILIGPDICKDETSNQEFEASDYILPSWVQYAKSKGLKFRIGRWVGLNEQPTVVLVDFTQYFGAKDEIFADFWERYSLDSLTGGWDYIEPCLFGYAAAKIIESYYEFYCGAKDSVVAQFHEWMTGSGILYLKDRCPQIATAFTTHATVLGRCVSGNRMPLYRDLASLDADSLALQFNLKAKQSLEKLSAQNADVFTTVSGITDLECGKFLAKSADVITPNGFDDGFVPSAERSLEIRKRVRGKLLDAVRMLTGESLAEDCLMVLTSGRYEFHNKGMDVFIEAMGRLGSQNPKRDVLAVVAVPANHSGPNAVFENGNGKSEAGNVEVFLPERFLSHRLFDEQHDSVLNKIRDCGLRNSSSDRVKIIFIPSYLDGADGVVNEAYFDFLQAFDLSVFASYYEPWGYTPMESVAFGIPTLTTDLAGFGRWMQSRVQKDSLALCIAERQEKESKNCVKEICDFVLRHILASKQEIEQAKREAKELGRSVVWEELLPNYMKAYSLALEKAAQRHEKFSSKQALVGAGLNRSTQSYKEANWRKIFFRQKLPTRLHALEKLSRNLWWTWNKEAVELFESINPEKFSEVERNPLPLLERLSASEIDTMLKDEDFLLRMDKVERDFDRYMQRPKEQDEDLCAYFSMEYGIDDCLKIFSGGLGILAGDYLKQASDSAKGIIGIGLLYRFGYFTQRITSSGEQLSEYNAQKFSHLPLQAVRDKKGEWQKVFLSFPGRKVEAKIWKIDVGRVPLYLLDTDVESNSAEDRNITARLYGGDNENRLKQEIVLGMGGVRLIEQLRLPVTLYHSNEGHAAFAALERVKTLIKQSSYSYAAAKELVRASTLFTTHTPVAAGHDMFDEPLLRAYLGHFADQLTISWEEFMSFGRMTKDAKEKFSMSVLAINFSAKVNGVSLIHRDVSRRMFAPLYEGYFPEESYIDYVTNGVHHLTWASKAWQEFYLETLGGEYLDDMSDTERWKKIKDVPNEVLWKLHGEEKKQLCDFLSSRLEKEYAARAEDPQVLVHTIKELGKDKLTVGFARRFATYKRANLLFTNLDKLQQIVEKGVRFIFAGKAHPNDKQGADLIARIIEVSRMPQFVGNVIFIENYDMGVAKQLVKGCDLWLNLPMRPLEASGTSGEKAVMNGVINFSVLDGWWAEGYREDAGWALSKEATYSSDDYQNALDAQKLYDIFLSQIIPCYNERDEKGVSNPWCEKMKNTICQIAPRFTMKRQLDDYYDKFYRPMGERTRLLAENNAALAKQYAAWKERVRRFWDDVRPIEFHYPSSESEAMEVREQFSLEVVLQTAGLSPKEIGVELIIANKQNGQINSYDEIVPFELCESSTGRGVYRVSLSQTSAGVHDYAIRVYPHCELMPHRQDLPLVKWI